jgi:hypothetical protein
MSAPDAPGSGGLSDSPQGEALLAAARSLLEPLVDLAIARGVRHADFEEMLKLVFIQAAQRAYPDVPAQRSVSRISTTTGINRREVTRLMQHVPAGRARHRSPATEVFVRWVSDSAYQRDGVPLRIARLGAAPSFEALATSVIKDVRPRTLLEELCRLGLARVADDDRVELLSTHFIPSNDEAHMLGFVATNVGDHLRAAADNILHPGVQHLEQALFADELSTRSIEHMRPVINERWHVLVRELAPLLQGLIDEDAAAGRPQDQRIRLGMYAYNAPMAPAPSHALIPSHAGPDGSPEGPANERSSP